MPEPHADRSTGLVFFGVLQVLLGLFCFLLLLRTAATARVNIAQSLFFDAAATFHFVAAGIGSIRKRRWACAVSAAMTAAWTVIGVFGLAAVLVLLPHETTTVMFFVFGMVLLPLVMALFYLSRDTALTCDERDPKARWTDRVPIPALALSLVLAFASVETLMTSGQPTWSFYGHILTGAPAALAMIALAILFAHLAIQVYRLRESAWWVLLLLHVIGGAMSAMTLGRVMHSAALWSVITIGWIAYLAFLIWLRHYFAGREGEAPAPLLST